MSFDMNPADEDPHGECRHEIQRLQATVAYYQNAFIQSAHRGDRCQRPWQVPSRIRLPLRISGDWPIGHDTHVGPGDFECQCNQWGAISVTAENGQLLGVKLHECEILEFKPNEKA